MSPEPEHPSTPEAPGSPAPVPDDARGPAPQDAPAPGPRVPVFDGHNDALAKLWAWGDDEGRAFRDPAAPRPEPPEGRFGGPYPYDHLDLARAREGGLSGGLFACFVPPARGGAPRAQPEALAAVLAQVAILRRMARLSGGALRPCRTAAEVEAAPRGSLAAVLHLEAADAIDPGLDALEVLHAAGLRSLGLVWSHANAFATGAPFRAGATSEDDGPGLTDAGRALVRACDDLGILVDTSHLNAAGLRDVARLSRRPVVATHSNAHALAPTSRNLTDDQLDLIAGTGGVVGLNFGTSFLRHDLRRDPDTGLDVMVRHLEHLMGRLGEGGVALGSDLDGTPPPAAIGDAAGFARLVAALRAAGWDEALIARVARGNWLRVLRDAEGRPGRPAPAGPSP